MPEATFKTRLALLEAECPKFQRQSYRRPFSQFYLNCLLTLELNIRIFALAQVDN
jgi:hypothetical protein